MSAERPLPALEQLLERLARDGDRHLAGDPATPEDLSRLAELVGRALPESFRAFLACLGGGLFYQGHEIFGPQRVMVHDIEMVPSLGAVLARLRAERLPDGLIPFSRIEGRLHFFDTRDPQHPDRVVSIPEGSNYPDLATFLRTVVLPPEDSKSLP